nr:MAG TPA: hypothetical protein [Caudoviricetes sp.]
MFSRLRINIGIKLGGISEEIFSRCLGSLRRQLVVNTVFSGLLHVIL